MNTSTAQRKHDSAHRSIPDEQLVIPGDAQTIAEETADLSPEKRPADPKMGPRALRLQMLIGYGLILVLAAALSVWMNPVAGVVALIFGTLGMLLNPVMGATTQRAQERKHVARHHRPADPDAVVLPKFSKRKAERMARVR